MFSGCGFFFHPELVQQEQLSRRAVGLQPGSFSGAFLGTELAQGSNWVILGCLGEAGRVCGGFSASSGFCLIVACLERAPRCFLAVN